MIALYSWKNGDGINFVKNTDMLDCMKLSMLQSAKWFERVVFITDSVGAKMAEEHALPCEIWNKLDNLNIHPMYWGMFKIEAMSYMTEPFCHIDNDFIFWQNPLPYFDGYDMCFQHLEDFAYCGPFYYHTMNEVKELAPAFYKTMIYKGPQVAYNCGVIACNDVSIIAAWKEAGLRFIDALHGKPFRHKQTVSHILEQYQIVKICKERKAKVNFVLEHLDWHTPVFTHLWGGAKQKASNIAAIRHKLSMIERYSKVKLAKVA